MSSDDTMFRAYKMAVKNRGIERSLIFHFGRGVQNANKNFVNVLDSTKNKLQYESQKKFLRQCGSGKIF